MGNQEEMLVKKITEIYESISKLPDLSPSKEVNALFTELVLACIPACPIDVSKLSNNGEQEMRSNLIRLCGEAEGLLESHYSDLFASSYENPLEHLELFPYYSNYLKLSHLEYSLLARHVPAAPAAARVAFVGSGPLPLSSIVLASRHMRAARFYNYDLSATANAQARRLVRADADVGPRMVFRTVDVMNATREEIAKYEVVFLAALVGIGREEKARVVAHLAASMAPGAALVVRSAHGARGFLYPVVETEDLEGFEVLAVHHPDDEVINSVIIARKPPATGGGGIALHGLGHSHGAVVRPCKCCDLQAMNHLTIEEVALEELPS